MNRGEKKTASEIPKLYKIIGNMGTGNDNRKPTI